MNYFSDNLKKIRMRQQYTQNELADSINVGNGSIISSWEKGTTYPEFENFIKLCEFLKVTPNDLIIGTAQRDLSIQDMYDSLAQSDKESVQKLIKEYLQKNDSTGTENIDYEDEFYTEISFPVFLKKSDAAREKMIKKVTDELLPLKKETRDTNETIANFLRHVGYDGYVSTLDIKTMFLKMKAPSEQLFEYVKAYLTGNFEARVRKPKKKQEPNQVVE